MVTDAREVHVATPGPIHRSDLEKLNVLSSKAQWEVDGVKSEHWIPPLTPEGKFLFLIRKEDETLRLLKVDVATGDVVQTIPLLGSELKYVLRSHRDVYVGVIHKYRGVSRTWMGNPVKEYVSTMEYKEPLCMAVSSESMKYVVSMGSGSQPRPVRLNLYHGVGPLYGQIAETLGTIGSRVQLIRGAKNTYATSNDSKYLHAFARSKHGVRWKLENGGDPFEGGGITLAKRSAGDRSYWIAMDTRTGNIQWTLGMGADCVGIGEQWVLFYSRSRNPKLFLVSKKTGELLGTIRLEDKPSLLRRKHYADSFKLLKHGFLVRSTSVRFYKWP